MGGIAPDWRHRLLGRRNPGTRPSTGWRPTRLVTLHFTPLHAVLGGLVLGAAAAGKLLTTGRVLGISGTVRGFVTNDFAPWRFAFIAGLAAGSALLSVLLPGAFEFMRASCPDAHVYAYLLAMLGGMALETRWLGGWGAAPKRC
ncbi:hypothetical protein TSOC_000009 [Tetrabaena socialis]|uniref:Uncharacterized protein n=1 Tax=Tetrabaena socialis TaxID=47790 RepID=A0A2J8AKG8_9CHLO|nr:hypothetical protein TSOC_000009 [Tetrabaena socialis]|eukprot:PNH13000.1 hypothetical protein TSOC_000009 [Tetrabaena socialis]